MANKSSDDFSKKETVNIKYLKALNPQAIEKVGRTNANLMAFKDIQ